MQQSIGVLEVERFEQMLLEVENNNIEYARDVCRCWRCLELSCLIGAITTLLSQIQPQSI
jgi:hypothetical protein